MKQYVTLDMVREHAGDRLSAVGQTRQEDLNWSDEEVISALEASARSYNSLPPFIGRITDATKLPADSDLFLDAAVATLFERKVRTMAPSRVQFSAGGVTTDPDEIAMKSMAELAASLRSKFTREATARKANANMMAAYGRF